jgi:SAM-dependent methyltransferase
MNKDENKKKKILEKIKKENFKLRKKIAANFKKQLDLEWGTNPIPEWFDHYIDLYFFWGWEAGHVYWLERGCYGLLALKDNARVLELCCGDGFNSKYFYSNKAKNIISLDFDKTAIDHANKYNKKNNIEFFVTDIRNDFPDIKFNNIIWDAAIEHFTQEEIKEILIKIKEHLIDDGILSGYTIVEKSSGKQHELHEYEFKSKEDLLRLLSPYFKNIRIFETIYPDRHNLYFYASDGLNPFDDGWEFQIIKSSNEK